MTGSRVGSVRAARTRTEQDSKAAGWRARWLDQRGLSRTKHAMRSEPITRQFKKGESLNEIYRVLSSQILQ